MSEHSQQTNEFKKKLDELINYFAKEFTEISYAAIIGVLTITIYELIERNKKHGK